MKQKQKNAKDIEMKASKRFNNEKQDENKSNDEHKRLWGILDTSPSNVVYYIDFNNYNVINLPLSWEQFSQDHNTNSMKNTLKFLTKK